ncbi:MAG: hypothetical protein P1U89_23845 [Verrucomicrobiales bacterium]|nr:hypothetical protein [Verrucomicrobiales bacterium]
MEFEEMQSRLEQNPGDWETRCVIAQSYYDAEHYTEAAQVIAEAPEIPFDEANVLFAATIIGTSDPEGGHGLLDQFIASNPSENAYELKAQLFEMSGDSDAAAACRAAISDAPVAVVALADDDVAEAVPVKAVEPISEPVPLKPKSLKPPGAEDDDAEDEEADHPLPAGALVVDGGSGPAPLNMELSQPIPLNVEAPNDPAHLTYTQSHQLERNLVVGEGEAVHGVEAAPPTNERIGAITAAIIVHVVIALLLLAAKVASPRPNPPQITASSIANSDDSSLDSTTMTKQTQKTAAAVSSSQPVVSSMAFSSFAMPDMPDMMSDLSMTSMSDSDAGFGMSMSGFGDVSNMGAIPAGMRSRCSMSERMKRLRESGGDDRAERAVRKGLEFLTSQQDKETGAIGHKYKVGMTGLTLLAYLGHCETPESPKFGDSVVKAALYMMDRGIKNKGKLTTDGEKGHHEAYEHAIGTYALSELYTMTKASGKEIPRLESVLKKAVDVIVDAQDPMGGWSYGFESGKGGTEDMSVTGWNIQALKAAYNTGKNFSKVEKTLDKAVKEFLPAIQDGKGAFKYRPENDAGKPTLTGAALLGMQIWHEMGSAPYNKGLSYLNNAYKNPSPGGNYYAPYYNTQVYFMHGGKEWESYNSKFQPKLLDAQNDDGSWLKNGAGGHGKEDAQIMNTAWAILMLEVYYRYLPTTDKVKDLKPR